jgi:hypothetical protein
MKLHTFFKVMVAIVFLLALLPFPTNAAEAPFVQVVASKANPAVGEEVTFSVNLKNFNAPSHNLSSFEVKLGFDPSYWEAESNKVEFGPYIQSLQAHQYEMPVKSVNPTVGSVHMALSIYKNDSVTYFSGDGTLFTFKLKPKKNGLTDVFIGKSLFVQISKPGVNITHGKGSVSLNIGGTTPPPPPPIDNGGGDTTPGAPVENPVTPVEVVKYVDDAKISPYAYTSVYKAQELGIMSGLNSEPRFGPSQSLTRAQFTKIILTMLGEKPAANSSQSFKDVPRDNWAYDYIMKAVDLGIIKGLTKETFDPGATITREQVALMIGRAYKIKPSKTQVTFKDETKINKEALPYIKALQEKRIIMGNQGLFQPKQTVTREMAAVIAVRMIETFK